MAFKVLNEEELALLTDKQRAKYEKKLNSYRKREAFVERLEKATETEREPYCVELAPIDAIPDPEVIEFKEQEVEVFSCEEIVLSEVDTTKGNISVELVELVPEINVDSAVQVKEVEIKTSEVNVEVDFKQPESTVREFKQPEVALQEIPSVESLDMNIKTVDMSESGRVNVSEIEPIVLSEVKQFGSIDSEVKVETDVELHFTELRTLGTMDVQIDSHDVHVKELSAPRSNIRAFELGEIEVDSVELNLSDMEIREVTMRDIELTTTAPKVFENDIRNVIVGKFEREKAGLNASEIEVPGVRAVDFKQPDKIEVDMYSFEITTPEIKEFVPVQSEVHDIPKIKEFVKPEPSELLKAYAVAR